MAMSKVFLVACWSITTLIVALALSACQTAATIADPPPAAAAPKNDWVAEIRRLAAAEKSYIEVLPLSDPAVTDLRGAACGSRTTLRRCGNGVGCGIGTDTGRS